MRLSVYSLQEKIQVIFENNKILISIDTYLILNLF